MFSERQQKIVNEATRIVKNYPMEVSSLVEVAIKEYGVKNCIKVPIYVHSSEVVRKNHCTYIVYNGSSKNVTIAHLGHEMGHVFGGHLDEDNTDLSVRLQQEDEADLYTSVLLSKTVEEVRKIRENDIWKSPFRIPFDFLKKNYIKDLISAGLYVE